MVAYNCKSQKYKKNGKQTRNLSIIVESHLLPSNKKGRPNILMILSLPPDKN
jgi:hypothetical protein